MNQMFPSNIQLLSKISGSVAKLESMPIKLKTCGESYQHDM